MRIAITLVFALVLCSVGVMTASAQPQPYIVVYFDNLQNDVAFCPGPSIDTLRVVAHNFNTLISAFEYSIQYSPGVGYLSHLADINLPPVVVGNSPTGISVGWGLPQNGLFPIFIHAVQVIWNCAGCGVPDVVRVLPHPATLFLGGVDFNTNAKIPAVGLTSTICPPPVPTDESSWGKVKSLYSE